MCEKFLQETKVIRRCREDTALLPLAAMQTTPAQGQFLGFLVRLTGARKALEFGVFTGYSSLWIAEALPPDGLLIACDISREWTQKARLYWQAAGLTDRIELRLELALNTANKLILAGGAGTFDFIFLDTDKANYPLLYEKSLLLLRPGGLLAIDNIFWEGAVVNPESREAETTAIRQLNNMVKNDSRVDLSILPMADGLLLVRKK